jgi:hypothetical protein
LAALATHRISGVVFPVTKHIVLNILADMHNLTADEDLMRLQESNICIRGRDFAGDGRGVCVGNRGTIGTFPYEQSVLSGALVALSSTEFLSLWLERHRNVLSY